MKKVLVIFFLFGKFQINAQEVKEKQYTDWSVGIRAGASLLPDFEDQLQRNYKLGLNAGINTTYKFNKFLSFKMEVNYAQKGKSYSYDEKDNLFTSFNDLLALVIDTSIARSLQGYVDDGVYSSYKGYHKLSYVEVPLLTEFNYYKFKLTAGPYLGILVNAYTKESLDQNIPLLDVISPLIDSLGIPSFLINGLIDSSFPGYKDTYISENTNSEKFTKFNFGFLLQLSYQIHQNTFLEARYARGLNSYLMDKSENIQLSTFALGLTYNFRIKKLNN